MLGASLRSTPNKSFNLTRVTETFDLGGFKSPDKSSSQAQYHLASIFRIDQQKPVSTNFATQTDPIKSTQNKIDDTSCKYESHRLHTVSKLHTRQKFVKRLTPTQKRIIENKLWRLLDKGGICLYLNVMDRYVHQHSLDPSPCDWRGETAFDERTNPRVILGKRRLDQIDRSTERWSSSGQTKHADPESVFRNEHVSISTCVKQNSKPLCDNTSTQTERAKTKQVSDTVTLPERLSKCDGQTDLKVKIKENQTNRTGSNNQPSLNRVKPTCQTDCTVRTDIVSKMVKVMNGDLPDRCWFDPWSNHSRRVFWIMLLKYELLPENWMFGMVAAGTLPEAYYPKFVRVKNRHKKARKMWFLFGSLLLLRIKQKAIETGNLFERLKFDSKFKMSNSRKSVFIKFMLKLDKTFGSRSKAQLRFESFRKVKCKYSVLNTIKTVFQNLTVRKQIFAEAKCLFVDSNGEFQKELIQQAKLEVENFYDKLLPQVSKIPSKESKLYLTKAILSCIKKTTSLCSKKTCLKLLETLEQALKISTD